MEGFKNIIGSADDDILTGDDMANVIEGLADADTLDGGGGIDTLSYASSNAGVTIDLNRGTGDFDDQNNTIKTASGGHASGDKIRFGSFENVLGSSYGDTITGDDGVNTLTGGAGNDKLNGDDDNDILNGGSGGDTLDGGDGDMDTATYADATEGVTIDLSSVSESNNVTTIRNSGGQGDARGDRFIDIEKFIGSDHDDTFIAGPEVDNVDGRGGSNTISYQSSRDPVVVALSDSGIQDINQHESRENYNYAKGDILTNIDNIIGSNVNLSTKIHGDGDEFDDVLTGNSTANVIDGRGGDDSISGGGGDDTLIGGSGSDTLTGGGGTDTFVINGKDTITDFDGDKLIFGSINSSPRTLSLNYTVDDRQNITGITSGSHQVTFDPTTVTNLTADNFVFNQDGYVKLTDDSPAGGDSTRGNATFHGGEGDNRITGGSNMDTINGNDGDDTISGGAGNDTLNGGGGDDTIEGGKGADRLSGGETDDEVRGDTLSYASSGSGRLDVNNGTTRSGVTVSLQDNSVSGGVGTDAAPEGDNRETILGFEHIIGSRYNDHLTGGNGINVIKGGSGSDWLQGGGGGNHLEGGSGKDRIIAGSDDFLSYEGSGSKVNVDLSDAAERAFTDAEKGLFPELTEDSTENNAVIKVSGGDAAGDIATGFFNVIGGRGGDALTGDGQVNILYGRGGNDTLTGNDGNDMLYGEAGNDTLKGGMGNDTLDGGPGADTLDGGSDGRDAPGTDIATYASAMAGVTVDLSGGNGGKGDAAGDKFEGIEQYVGSNHADTFIAGKDADHITGGPGDDGADVNGATNKDTVSYIKSDKGVTVNLSTPDQGTDGEGYEKGDTLNNIENVIGSRYDDTLTASESNDSFVAGGRGDDILNDGSGGATNSNNNIYVFAPGDDADEINGFTVGDDVTAGRDQIDLSAFTRIASLEDLKDDISWANGDIRINLSNGDSIRLISQGTRDADFHGLTADNFIFYTKKISGNQGDRFDNEINGSSGANAIYGEGGNDTINGGGGNDEIYGGEGKDMINGGAGDDWLDGGSGDDTFVFEPGHGNDVIMDFEADDKIILKGFKNAAGEDLNDGISAQNGVIDLSEFGGGTITLEDYTGAVEIDYMVS